MNKNKLKLTSKRLWFHAMTFRMCPHFKLNGTNYSVGVTAKLEFGTGQDMFPYEFSFGYDMMINDDTGKAVKPSENFDEWCNIVKSAEFLVIKEIKEKYGWAEYESLEFNNSSDFNAMMNGEDW